MKHGVIFFLCVLSGALCVHAQGNALRSAGTDFWTAFPTNDPNQSVNSIGIACNLTIYVTAEAPATISATMNVLVSQRRRLGKSWGWVPQYDTVITKTYTVGAMQTVIISVDTVNNLRASGVALPYSVHITSTAPVRVFTLNHKTATSDGVTVFPTTLLDTEYVLIAHQNDHAFYRTYASEAAFIATSDSTYLTIHSTAQLKPSVNSPFTILLRKGQVYQISCDTNFYNADLTGTIVTGSKPFVAISGVERAWVQTPAPGGPDAYSRDHMIEQMLPVKYFGRTYLVGPTSGVYPNYVKIVAASDNTTVIVNDSISVLQRGQFLELPLSVVTIVRADKPILSAEEEPSSNDGIGDPDLTLVPPMRGYDSLYVVYNPLVRDTLASNGLNVNSVTYLDTTIWRDVNLDNVNRHDLDTSITFDSTTFSQFTNYTLVTTILDSTFSGDSIYIHNFTNTKSFQLGEAVYTENHLTAIMRAEDQALFSIDGEHQLASDFKGTPFCDYVWFTRTVPYGTHVVSAPHGFSLISFGYTTADSYQHLAGLRIGADDSIATENYAFGKQRIRTSRTITHAVRNLGLNSVAITNAQIVGRDAAFFQVINDTLPQTMALNDSLSFTVSFDPDTTRDYAAYLQLCTDISVVRIPLSGTGIASRLKIIPQLTDWGLRKAPSRSDSSVTICNVGNDSALVVGVFLITHDSSIFSTDSLTFTLQPGECKPLRINFHPKFAGDFSGTIEATSDSPYDSIVGANLAGSSAGLILLVDSIDYGTLLLASAVRDSQAYITNVSNARPVKIDTLTLAGPSAAQFQILYVYKSPNKPLGLTFPQLLQTNETLWVKVSFMPTVIGPATASITVHADAPSDDILLTGNVLDIVAPTLAGINLDTLCESSGLDTSVVFQNKGTSNISIVNIAIDDVADFSIPLPSLPLVVEPDSIVPIHFRTHQQRGPHQGTLTVTYAHGTDTLRSVASLLTVFGVGDSLTSLPAWRTGDIAVNDTATFCFTVWNYGDDSVTLDSISMNDTSGFTITAQFPLNIGVNDSLCIGYTFTPSRADSFFLPALIFAHGPCGAVESPVALIGIGKSIVVNIDSVDFNNIFSCTQRDSFIAIKNVSSFNATITGISATDGAAPFMITAQLPIALNAGATVDIPVHFEPVAAGTFSTDFIFAIKPADPSHPLAPAYVSGTAAPLALASHIDSTYHAQPGTVFTLNVKQQPGIAVLGLHTVQGTIHFNPNLLQVYGHTTNGTAINGFIEDQFTVDNSLGTIVFQYHSTLTISDDSILLSVRFMAMVGDTMTSPLPLTIDFPDNANACVAVQVLGGLFTTDSICGMRPVSYRPGSTLAQNAPNPFNDETTITFSVASPGPVRVSVVDQLGRVVQTPVDANLPVGAYSIAVHGNDLAPGIFYYTLTTTDTHCSKQMLILR